MWQDHFVFEGKTYYTGTVFKVKEYEYPFGICEKEAAFIAYNPEYKMLEFQVGPQRKGQRPDMLKSWIVSVTDKKNERVRCPVRKKRDELQIDGMLIGWMWYIVLMAVATIFNGRIGLWGLISWIFFSWRAKKIEKEGYYIEW